MLQSSVTLEQPSILFGMSTLFFGADRKCLAWIRTVCVSNGPPSPAVATHARVDLHRAFFCFGAPLHSIADNQMPRPQK